jgi:phosphate transport system substrate-binding protein
MSSRIRAVAARPRSVAAATRRAVAVAGVLAAGALVVGCGSSSPRQPPPATASPPAGSTVVQIDGIDYASPIYEEVGNRLQGSGVTLNYRVLTQDARSSPLGRGPVGLLAGASSTQLGNLPFVRSTSELYVPIGFGATAVIENVPGLHGPLQLSGPTLADIYLGRVRKWDAREIQKDNPNAYLPDTPITVVHRSDPTTATDLFTRYLAASSKRWRKGPGHGVTVSWPTGTGESDDASLRETIAQMPGAIGYTDQDTALQNDLPTVRLRNGAGQYVAPTLHSIGAAGTQARAADRLDLTTIDARVPDAYPAVAEVYMLTLRDACNGGLSHPEAAGVQHVLDYMLGPGQRVVRQFSFAPLPNGLRASARAAVRRLQCGGQEI